MCGYHSTGRSAAFWLESYGGRRASPLTLASRPLFEPAGRVRRRGFLRRRGALHLSDHGDVGAERRADRRPRAGARARGARARWSRGSATAGPACSSRAAPTSTSPRFTPPVSRQFQRRAARSAPTRACDSRRRRADRWEVETAGGSSTVVRQSWSMPPAPGPTMSPSAAASRRSASQPKRRTMVQLRVGRRAQGPAAGRSIAAARFYFKGEGDRSVWVSPHDETRPIRATPRPRRSTSRRRSTDFERAVDWPVEAVERKWAGLRTFAPDRACRLRLRSAMRRASSGAPGRAGSASRPRRPRRSWRGAAARRTAPDRAGRGHRPRRLLAARFG